MKTHHIEKQDKVQKTRLATRVRRFKSVIEKHPETSAYCGTLAVSVGAQIAQGATKEMAFAGITMLSMFNVFGSFTREASFARDTSIYGAKGFSVKDRIVTGSIAATGFVAGSAILLAGNSNGMFLGGAATLLSILYKPIKDLLTDTRTNVMQKSQKLLGGAIAGIGIISSVTALSEVGVGGLLNQVGQKLGQTQMMIADAVSLAVGIGVAALGLKMLSGVEKQLQSKNKN